MVLLSPAIPMSTPLQLSRDLPDSDLMLPVWFSFQLLVSISSYYLGPRSHVGDGKTLRPTVSITGTCTAQKLRAYRSSDQFPTRKHRKRMAEWVRRTLSLEAR